MDADKKSAHFYQISTYKPQLLVLSSIQEHPSSKSSDKAKIKASVAEVGDSEIGVFGAEKYFSMKLDHVDKSTVDITKQQEKENKEEPPHPHPSLTKTASSRSRTSRHGTPSVRSESSYNSQTFLMKFKNNNDNKQRRTNETSVSFGGFRCNSPCSGVKTVNTNRKISSKGRNFDQDFVSYDARKHIDKPRIHFEAKKTDYPGPGMIPLPNQRSDIAMNLEKKLSMLTWDAIPNQNHLSTKNNNHHSSGNNSSLNSKTQEEETASEASSDLFEIENITSSVYEPSEASIGWSVVTASMADQSVISDFDMMKRVTRNGSVVKSQPAIAEKVRSGGFLSGCKSQKAVSVFDSTRNVKGAKVDHEMSRQKKFKAGTRIQDLTFL